MTVILDTKGTRLCELSTFDLPLQKGTRFVLDPKILNRDHETQYQLIDWQYRITNKPMTPDTISNLELVVKEVSLGFFESRFQRLSNDTQFWAPTTAAVVTLLVGSFIAVTLYLLPTHGLVFLGKHIRTFGVLAIILLFIFLLPWKLGLYSPPRSFRKSFFCALVLTSGWLLCALWLFFSNLPANFHGTDAEYVAYSKALGQSMSRSYWPLLVAALPWLSVSFKVLGFDTAEKASEGLEKLSKEK
jgi:hypothetical protein